MGHRIGFEEIPFSKNSPHSRSKTFVRGSERVRIVEFSEGFIEPDWCTKGHIGYMLGGAFSIDFNGNMERFEKGDCFLIPKGEEHRHKAILKKGEKAVVLLIETI